MKKYLTPTENFNFIGNILIVSMFLFLTMEVVASDGCVCNGTVVKFNWENGAFVLEPGDDQSGISITNVNLDADNQPNCFNWSSVNPWVISVCLKLANNYETTYYSGGTIGGQICAQIVEGETDYHAISHIEFCVDKALPVELSSFSATISGNIASLVWETATEVNNYGFEVQRTSKKDEWSKVGFVEGHGNSNSPKHYEFTDNSFDASGNYSYRLKQIDIDGTFEYSDVVELNISAPEKYTLNSNYPNPFNPTTVINYSIPEAGYVSLVVHDVIGKEVARLENGFKNAGSYSKTFNATNLSSGLYFYTISTEKFIATKKMLLMK